LLLERVGEGDAETAGEMVVLRPLGFADSGLLGS
jgi:hypothetical protein